MSRSSRQVRRRYQLSARNRFGFDITIRQATTWRGCTTFGLSRIDAVSTAVDNQLVTDDHPDPHDPTAVMQDDYDYVRATMQGFLLGVADGLRRMGFRFDPGSIAPSVALQKELRQLKFAIWEKTR